MKYTTFFLSMVLAGLLSSCVRVEQVAQESIARIDSMPNFPTPYKMLDWKQKAKDFDAFAFDYDSDLPSGPVIWLDSAKRNISQVTFGLYTAIHDVRQGPNHNNGEFHESLNSMAAILGVSLIGIDKSQQDGFNYVKMLQNYFNSDTGWNIMMNNTCPEVALQGGDYGRDWWYDVLPNALFYAICDLYPGIEGADEIQYSIAEQFYKADSVLNGNYDYSYFDYGQMKGMTNNIPFQQDAAGGHGYVLYSAYQKFKDPRYLEAAKSAINVLHAQKESRFYEILLPLGIYTAARLNAEEGTQYDITKMISWAFEGCTSKTGRTGWGIIVGRWGDNDVSGLQGSITSGYAFLMNSIKMAWPLVPLVKYQPQYTRAIGKWMLNNANACRLFFPNELDDKHQWLPELKNITQGVVAYEGLIVEDNYGNKDLKGISPMGIGDGPRWNPANPSETMFSLYSTSPVGILGAIVDTTNMEGILRLDCNCTDFYADKKYPVYLYYNPYQENKKVVYKSSKAVDLYNKLTNTYLQKDVIGTCEISIPADQACLIVEIPAGEAYQPK
ncbi:MAG: hypothetical protein LUF01_08380 [Bacteroides sp.]|nr:hypothetical protein [Bacteroides sp.]